MRMSMKKNCSTVTSTLIEDDNEMNSSASSNSTSSIRNDKNRKQVELEHKMRLVDIVQKYRNLYDYNLSFGKNTSRGRGANTLAWEKVATEHGKDNVDCRRIRMYSFGTV